MTISVVISHLNRPEFLKRSLMAYRHTQESLDDVEFVVVDDNSYNRADEVCKEMSKYLNITYFYRKEKPDKGQSRSNNIGVSLSSGDILVIANTECFPIAPIFEEIRSKITSDRYLSMLCYSISGPKQHLINQLDCHSDSYISNILSIVGEFVPRQYVTEGSDGWYNHPIYRPCHFFFTAALPRELFLKMGGFDEAFSVGVGFEDDDIVRRIKVLGVPIDFGEGIVLHQNHYSASWSMSEGMHLLYNNQAVYQRKSSEGNWKSEKSLFYEGNQE